MWRAGCPPAGASRAQPLARSAQAASAMAQRARRVISLLPGGSAAYEVDGDADQRCNHAVGGEHGERARAQIVEHPANDEIGADKRRCETRDEWQGAVERHTGANQLYELYQARTEDDWQRQHEAKTGRVAAFDIAQARGGNGRARTADAGQDGDGLSEPHDEAVVP